MRRSKSVLVLGLAVFLVLAMSSMVGAYGGQHWGDCCDWGDDAEIVQVGVLNDAYIYQKGEMKINNPCYPGFDPCLPIGCATGGNSAAIFQMGYMNKANISQVGALNHAVTSVYGFLNDITISQNGALLQAVIGQGGFLNKATINQGGVLNFASIDQFGTHNMAAITQTAARDTAGIVQMGHLNNAQIVQN